MSSSKTHSSKASITRLAEIVAVLRAPGGCPWDREQTHQTLRPSLLEECYEVIDAIERNDVFNLKEELGDLLVNIIMHTQLAEESSAFDLEAVAHEACEKLIRRHPHVFEKNKASQESADMTTDEVLQQWDKIKQQEKREDGSSKKIISALDGVPHSFPALLRAHKIQTKAAKVGFDWKNLSDVVDKIREELDEVAEALATSNREHQEEELGDLLFSIVNLTRSMEMNAELLLQQATKKFIRRFHSIESILQKKNQAISDCSFEELNELWEKVKEQG